MGLTLEIDQRISKNIKDCDHIVSNSLQPLVTRVCPASREAVEQFLIALGATSAALAVPRSCPASHLSHRISQGTPPNGASNKYFTHFAHFAHFKWPPSGHELLPVPFPIGHHFLLLSSFQATVLNPQLINSLWLRLQTADKCKQLLTVQRHTP